MRLNGNYGVQIKVMADKNQFSTTRIGSRKMRDIWSKVKDLAKSTIRWRTSFQGPMLSGGLTGRPPPPAALLLLVLPLL